jgi:cytochrome c553
MASFFLISCDFVADNTTDYGTSCTADYRACTTATDCSTCHTADYGTC